MTVLVLVLSKLKISGKLDKFIEEEDELGINISCDKHTFTTINYMQLTKYLVNRALNYIEYDHGKTNMIYIVNANDKRLSIQS